MMILIAILLFLILLAIMYGASGVQRFAGGFIKSMLTIGFIMLVIATFTHLSK